MDNIRKLYITELLKVEEIFVFIIHVLIVIATDK